MSASVVGLAQARADEELVPAGVRIVEVEPMLTPIPHPVFVTKEDERNGVN
jgi:hypothetical protein